MDLLTNGAVILVAHAMVSVVAFYGESHIPYVSTWPALQSELTSSRPKVRLIGVRKVSNLTATLGLAVVLWLVGWAVAPLDMSITALAAVCLGTIHFYTMEIDYRLVLGVRPFGFVPFVLAGAAMLRLALLTYMYIKQSIL